MITFKTHRTQLVLLFVVFALSSWNFRRPENGYDAVNAAELSNTAEHGSAGRQIGMACLALYTIANVGAMSRLKRRGSGTLACLFITYLAWALSSVIWSTDIALTSKAAVRLLVMIAGAIVVGSQLDTKEIAQITFWVSGWTLVISVVVEAIAGGFDLTDPSWRFAGLLHPVAQGWNCSLLSMSAIYLSTRRARNVRVAYLASTLIGFALLVLTKSRVAFAGTVLIIAIYYLCTATMSQKIVSVAVAGIGICLITVLISGNVQRYVAFGRESDTEASFGTLTGRIPLWQDCIRYAKQRPLCGYGYNAFLSPANLLGITDASGWMSSPHSGYIGTYYELGLTGVVVLIAMLSLAVKLSIKEAMRDRSELFTACILVWMAGNLVTEAFLLTGCFYATFLLFALLGKVSFTCSTEVGNSATAHHLRTSQLSSGWRYRAELADDRAISGESGGKKI
jgi:O-antigen ligase